MSANPNVDYQNRLCAEIERLTQQVADLRAALDQLMLVGSAATGFLMVSDFGRMHAYVEQIMGRSVWTHEMGERSTAREIRDKAHSDFQHALEEANRVLAATQPQEGDA